MTLTLALLWLLGVAPAPVPATGHPTTVAARSVMSEFGYPDGVALARDGSLYVVDTDNSALKKISPAGEITTVLATSLQYPTGVALAADGTLFIADAGSRAVWRLAPGATTPDKLTGRGFTYPSALALAPDGTLYVADSGLDGRGSVQKITPNGRAEVLAHDLHKPTGLALAPDGTLYVAESGSSTIRCLTAAGATTLPLPTAALDQPRGLALGTDGVLYVADTFHHRVLTVSADGQVATLAEGFSYPSGVAVDAAGTVYVTDTGHGTVRRISHSGAISAVVNATEAKASAAPLK